MDQMGHKVWMELENYFGTRISEAEQQHIVSCIRKVVASHPEIPPEDMTDLTLEVTEQILKLRKSRYASR